MCADHNSEKGQWVGNRAANNTLVGKNLSMASYHVGITLAQWQDKNPAEKDVGTTYEDISIDTQTDEIIEAAKELLGL